MLAKQRQFRTLTAKVNTKNITDKPFTSAQEKMLLHLYETNQISNADQITFGKKGMRVNHKPVKYEKGQLIYLENFKKPYQHVIERKKISKTNKYEVRGNTIVLFTNQGDKSVEIKIDKRDFSKINMHTWHAFNYMKGAPSIVCRKKENSKWVTYKFEELLGYKLNGKQRKKVIKHKNGDIFDFTRANLEIIGE